MSQLHLSRPRKSAVVWRGGCFILTKNMMEGEAALAFLNISRTALSDSPTYLFNSYPSQLDTRERVDELTSGPLTAIKFKPLSVASALAVMVLLHPGGPYSNTPLGASTPSRLNVSRWVRGHSTHSFNFRLIISCPPISVHRTEGVSTNTSRIVEGRIDGRMVRTSSFCKTGVDPPAVVDV